MNQPHMTCAEVIELLSSDNEAAIKPISSRRPQGAPSSKRTTDPPTVGDKVSTTLDAHDDWTASSPKRRRLSRTAKGSSLPRYPSGNALKRLGIPNLTASDFSTAAYDDDDPIVFTSSSHQTTTLSRERIVTDMNAAQDVSSDDSLSNNIWVASRSSNAATTLSSTTEALLASFSQSSKITKPSYGSKQILERARRKPGLQAHLVRATSKQTHSEGCVPTNVEACGSKKIRMSEEERQVREKEKERAKEARTRDKELAKERRAKGREEDRERKRIEREDKAEEKRKASRVAEVNKSKLDKKDSTPEMIIDLPASLSGSDVDLQVREYCKNLNVDTALYQSPVPHVIKWRRKTKAKWNPDLEHWEPLPQMVIRDEQHVLCLLQASDFVSLALAPPAEEDLQMHLAKLKTAYENCTPIYMIEGLHTLIKRSKNAENRAFQARVLGQDPQGTKGKRKRDDPIPFVDETAVEAALLRLQVTGGCLIHHTGAPKDTAEWIASFTQHISTIPYRYVYYPSTSIMIRP